MNPSLTPRQMALRPAFLGAAYGPAGQRICLALQSAAALPGWVRGRWAIVTAWNPDGQLTSPALNHEAHLRLEAAVRGAGLSGMAAQNGADEWAEASLLIPGATLAQAQKWGEEFGQLASLYCVGRRAALVWKGGVVERFWAGNG